MGSKRGRPREERATDAQLRALNAIKRCIVQRSYPPTMQELADEMQITPASAHELVSQLVKKGFLKREPRKARGLTILREPEHPVASLTPVPLVGTVKAGFPVLSEENIDGEVLVEEHIAGRGRCFALSISGNSMINAGIRDGDVVIVRQQMVAENGEIIVALVDGETTVKRLHIRGDEIELRAENPEYPAIHIEPDSEIQILGKVIAIRSKPGG